ncbi:hypothetical protein PPERSA_00470 [Pseudocohnilembus persalinus]|uniref:Uncharacterized protein n=1 Tax=Pseudocohnilembus persalinus TaxID=266149 RepID=A0A0V0QIE3_PSEPJ|nr:hypothetical protein PPERSA_00470 [Pseudocohnilembus persalinus]|eukprot:KRX01848.1 hypothetical protein PPERSA_00470 [Pseudocohnilembus persalinus]
MENKEQQIGFQKKLSQVNNFGCVAINRETLQVLLIKLRWTRSGAKSLFHILNGLDNTEKDIENINQILQNCTDKELKIFSTDINKLLNESKIPVSWQYKNGINLKENIQNNFEFIKKICLKELEFRNKSQTYKPNPDQLSRHMWMIPKGKAEKSQNYNTQPTQIQQNEQDQQTENQAQYIIQNQQINNDNQYTIKQYKDKQNVQQLQNDLEFQMINAKREFSEETDVPEQDIYFVQDSQNQYVSFQASNGLKVKQLYINIQTYMK